MKLYGIIGYPLGHSFSQKYFTEKFINENITNCSYLNFPIKSILEFKDIIAKNNNLLGLNVTIPYKQTVLPYLDDCSNLPTGILACNCIKIKNNKLIGYNTDIIGFEQSLISKLKNYHTDALILGNGGAAEAVKFVLKKLNINYKIVGRKLHDDTNLIYEEITPQIINSHLLIINTTPVGTFPNIDECVAIPYHLITNKHYFFDLVYNPNKTLFLQKAAHYGASIKNGYDMLTIQAEAGWKIWND